jgi:cation:H+ antiporter
VIPILLALPGFLFLLQGANYLIDGASALAKRLGVSTLVIGLTVVAFGTSMPELAVSLYACLKVCTDIVIGNIVGSNIANILLILGIGAIIYPLNVKHGTVWREIPLALLAVVVLGLLVSDIALDGHEVSVLSRIDGWILLSYLVIFLYYAFVIRKAEPADPQEVPVHRLSAARAWMFIALGLLGLVIGGRWVVDGAVALATLAGISQATIAATVVAVGTSLPELVTTVAAARKHDVDIAVGNAVGSNIINVFGVLGIAAVTQPIGVPAALGIDIVIAAMATMVLFLMMFLGRRHILDRSQGVFFIVLYGGYLAYLLWRG